MWCSNRERGRAVDGWMEKRDRGKGRTDKGKGLKIRGR